MVVMVHEYIFAVVVKIEKKLTDEEFHWGFAEQYRIAELHKTLLDVHVLPNEIIYN